MDTRYRTSLALWITLAATAGCSSSSNKSPADAAPSLRPGVEDSSQVFQGAPNAHESAFWAAVRDGDDAGRAAAVSQLMADVQDDPKNGYSEFLIGASYSMPPNAVLRALADGTPIQPALPDAAAMPYLKESLSNLTDPFYLGFAGGLLGVAEIVSGDTAEGGPTLATAASNNPVATRLMTVISDLVAQNAANALKDMYVLVEYCNGGPLDHNGGGAADYVAKLNAGGAVQRECYSGYFAPHGSSGEMLLLADLQALNGNQPAANAYYRALQGVSDYSTWALKPLAERRLSGAQKADIATEAIIPATCVTCHTDTLK